MSEELEDTYDEEDFRALCPLYGGSCVGEENCHPALAMRRRFDLDDAKKDFVECPIVTAIASLAVTAQALLPLTIGLGEEADKPDEDLTRERVLDSLKLDQEGL